jgi:hypothetical protein
MAWGVGSGVPVVSNGQLAAPATRESRLGVWRATAQHQVNSPGFLVCFGVLEGLYY